MEKCDSCGADVDMENAQVCAGALANEVQQGVFGPIDTTLLLSCYCCEKCRNNCLDSFIEENR